MSNVKKGFNGRTVLMFLGCLALSIVITQPILARADGNNVEIDTEFSEIKNMSVFDLYVYDSANIGNGLTIGNTVIKSGQFCNSEDTCISINGDTISFNKIKIGLSDDNTNYVILSGTQSGTQLLTSDPHFNDGVEFYLNEIDTLVTPGSFYNLFAEKIMTYEFGWGEEVTYSSNSTGIEVRPMWTQTGWIAGISFKDENENENIITCSGGNAGTMHYLETTNGSQLIVCMKTSNDQYTGAIIKEYTNGSTDDSGN